MGTIRMAHSGDSPSVEPERPTRVEFAAMLAYLTAGCGKSLSDDAAEVYFDLLGDLPPRALMAAAKQALLEPLYNAFPPVSRLRGLAIQAMAGPHGELSAGEAWELAYRFAREFDPELSGPYMKRGKLFDSQADAMLDGLPPLVTKAIRAFGFAPLANANPVYSKREFIAIFEQLAARERKQALLPAPLRDEMEAIASAKPAPPPPVLKIVNEIGRESA